MAKPLPFKLSGLLKLREFKEHKIKIELGQLNKEMSAIVDKIYEMNRSLEEGFKNQDELDKQLIVARTIQYFPQLNEGIRAQIKILILSKLALEKKFAQKREEFYVARGDVKVILKMKEKLDLKNKYESLKEEESNIQEQVLMNFAPKTQKGDL